MKVLKVCRLAPWEEAIGTLHQLDHDEGSLLVTIGPVLVHLPLELEKTLQPYIGKKVSILRTDTRYVWRTYPE